MNPTKTKPKLIELDIDINDTVYFMLDNKIHEATVTGIGIQIDSQGCVRRTYRINEDAVPSFITKFWSDYEVYKSKTDLIDALLTL